MNLTYKPRDRRVVPNWRYYETTLAAGELDNWRVARSKRNTYSIDEYEHLWNEHNSIYRAGDLISAAITNGKEESAAVKDAAEYILEREKESTRSLLESAQKVLGLEAMGGSASKIEIERLKECTSTEEIRKYIHNVRQRLQIMPYNPFLYVDLSRAYLLNGQNQKAEDAILQAIHFGASDRFVARSAARFYLHTQDKDRAYELIRAKGAVSSDPWLLSAEITINMLRGKTSNYINKGRDLIESGNCIPFGFTELASTIGTLELSAGSNRKSNKLFRKALIAPNDNSLAQVQWVKSFEPLPFDVNTSVRNDYEVRTYEALSNGDFDRARHEAVSWICDMPFSHKPINVGSEICIKYLHDFSLASAIIDVGLRSDDTSPYLLNNKAYCLARSGDIPGAKEAFERLQSSPQRDESAIDWMVCTRATEGLIFYRDHNLELGAAKYKEAIDIAKKTCEEDGNSDLYKKAVLNYCRERIIAKDGDTKNAFTEASSIILGEGDNELRLLYEEIVEEFNKSQL